MIAPPAARVAPVATAHTRFRRLPIPALGAALLLLVGLGDVTGVPYLLVRSGWSSPVALARVDGTHIEIGVIAAVVLVVKVGRVGARRVVHGVALPQLWHRWMSAGLGVTYLAVLVSGALLLPHWPAHVRTALVNLHLLTAVWAAVPTAWHVWHYRRLLSSRLRLGNGIRPPRLLLGAAVLLIGAALPALWPRALGPLTQEGAGGSWVAAGPRRFMDRMELTPDQRWIVAGGKGLFVRAAAGRQWEAVASFPAEDTVLALSLPPGPVAAYVGTDHGLYSSLGVRGPYQKLPFPSSEVHGIAVDPGHAQTVWASAQGGFFVSHDSGQHWARAVDGLSRPATAWAVGYFRGTVFAADVDGVYTWSGTRWVGSSAQGFVVTFDTTRQGVLLASSMGQGVSAWDGREWADVSAGLPRHGHNTAGGSTHVVSVTEAPEGMVYAATMLEGIAVSDDGGRSWASAWPGLRGSGTIWRVLEVDGQLVAATDRGLIAYDLPAVEPPSAVWWTMLVITAVATAGVAILLAASRTRAMRAAASRVGHGRGRASLRRGRW